MLRKPVTIVATGFAILLTAGAAQAAMITYQFGGVFGAEFPPAVLGITPGDTFSGTFRIDSDAVDQYPLDPTWGFYQSPTARMTLSFGSWQLEANGLLCRADMHNDTPDGDYAGIAAGPFSNGGLVNTWIGVGWSAGPSSSAWPDDRLQNPPADIRGLLATLNLSGTRPGYGDFLVNGTLTYLIPEPAYGSAVALLSVLLVHLRKARKG